MNGFSYRTLDLEIRFLLDTVFLVFSTVWIVVLVCQDLDGLFNGLDRGLSKVQRMVFSGTRIVLVFQDIRFRVFRLLENRS
jgi:hypothetical protein